MISMREPAVAGSFYPEEQDKLAKMINEYLQYAKVDETYSKEAKGFVAPHAGYIYSGRIAAYTYKAIYQYLQHKKVDTIVIIGPNHTGAGSLIAVSDEDWVTPFGIFNNDHEFTRALSKIKGIDINEAAHEEEHSIEVQLPFIQFISRDFDIKGVFICMLDQSYYSSELLANAINKVKEDLEREIIVIASSDFNHYESAEIAKSKDLPAIEALEKLDMLKFNDIIERVGDTACGFGPITVAGLYAKMNGASRGILLNYGNSGDINKDYSSVVAYASLIFV